MALRRPPQYRADARPLFIARTDSAWDDERITREREAAKKAGGPRHPVDAYYSGETRYDLDAVSTVDGQAVTVRDYLRAGATPTVFTLRRDAQLALQRAQAISVVGDAPAWTAAMWSLARHGLVEAADGFTSGAPGARWPLEGGGPRPLTDADLQLLHDLGDGLLAAIGTAVFHANAPLSEAEGKA